MTNLWKVNVNGRNYEVDACMPWTAISKCVKKEDTYGTIQFQLLRKLKSIKCPDCGRTYLDTPRDTRLHLFEDYTHIAAVKKKQEEAEALAHKLVTSPDSVLKGDPQ